MQVRSTQVHDFAALGAEWRDLEMMVWRPSFFRSWTWVGCLAEERFPDPVLFRGEVEGRTVALALFNRRRGQLCLGESGHPVLDAPFVEHNGPLIGEGTPADAAASLLRAALRAAGGRGLLLAGVEPAIAGAAGGIPWRAQKRLASFVDLAEVRARGGDYVTTRSANTRAQIRRSDRSYAIRGELRLECARDAAEALTWFDALRSLHDSTWAARGSKGAFATPYLLRFHRALITTAANRGELDMLRVTAGGSDIGYLYNFRLGGRVSNYQSGLDYVGAGAHGKPGMTCHAMAVQRAVEAGDLVYDLLAGEARYKRSLSTGVVPLLWTEVVRTWSARGIATRLRHLIKV